MFDTETMAELSARQGRQADAGRDLIVVASVHSGAQLLGAGVMFEETRRRILPLLVLAAVLLSASSAHAEEPPPVAPPANAAPDSGGWYGLVPTLVDGLSVVAFYEGVHIAHQDYSSSLVDPLVFTGLAGLLGGIVVAPVNHARAHHPGRAAASVALRLLGLLTFVAIEGANRTPCGTQESQSCDLANRYAFEGLPWLVMMGIDDGLLAWRPASGAMAPASPRPSFDAMLSVVRGAPGISFVGAF